MKTLVSLTDFVISQIKTDSTVNDSFKKDLADVRNYALFLKQPLTLGMFVPTDESGNVLEEFRRNEEEFIADVIGHCRRKSKEELIWERAQKNILFKPPYNHYWKLDEIEGKKVEDLLIDKIEYELTESAIKQITG